MLQKSFKINLSGARKHCKQMKSVFPISSVFMLSTPFLLLYYYKRRNIQVYNVPVYGNVIIDTGFVFIYFIICTPYFHFVHHAMTRAILCIESNIYGALLVKV